MKRHSSVFLRESLLFLVRPLDHHQLDGILHAAAGAVMTRSFPVDIRLSPPLSSLAGKPLENGNGFGETNLFFGQGHKRCQRAA